jgi:HK97 family phage portal protein
MGLLTQLATKDYTVADWIRDTTSFFRGAPTAAGVRINEKSAMRLITVYACMRVLAESMGCLPLFVYKKRKGGGADTADDHNLYGILHDEPNDEMASQTWIETKMGHLVLSGDCYSLKTLNGRGQIIDLYPVPWDQIEPVRNPQTDKLEYRYNDRGTIETLPAEQVLHIPGLGYDGIRGYSSIQMAREAIGLGLAAQEFAGKFFSQGMNVGGVLEAPEKLSKDAIKNMRESLEERGAGMANSWRPLILEEGTKWARIPMPMTDAQFLEQRKFTRDEICAFMRVPPHMVANLERSTNNNITQQSVEFVMYTLGPYVRRFEQALNRSLFTRQERAAGYYVKFNIKALLRGDVKTQAEALNIQRQNGIINADEWRELEEMNPQPNGTGQAYLVNGNMIPVELAARDKTRSYWTLNEKRKADGLKPLPGGDAIFLPATEIAVVEVDTEEGGDEM